MCLCDKIHDKHRLLALERSTLALGMSNAEAAIKRQALEIARLSSELQSVGQSSSEPTKLLAVAADDEYFSLKEQVFNLRVTLHRKDEELAQLRQQLVEANAKRKELY